MAYLSTPSVADLMDVTETTVKRWADEGKITCHRTLGGHRKFLMSDVVRFAEEHAYPLRGAAPEPLLHRRGAALDLAVHREDYGALARLLFAEVAKADRKGIAGVLSYLSQHRLPFARIADEVIRPAMVRIGEQWNEGTLEIHQEHLIANTLLEVLIEVRQDLHRKPANGRAAVCACAEGDFHELGLRLLAYTLETEGFRVRYLGANTPAGTLSDYIRTTRPDIVGVSVNDLTHPEGWIPAIGKSARAVHAIFLVGGHGVASPAVTVPPVGDLVGATVTEAVDYVRTYFGLKPGPRKTTRHRESGRDA